MVPTTGPAYANLSVALRRFFQLIQLVELIKLFLECLFGEFYSHWPFGHSCPKATDYSHAVPAFG